MKSRLFTRGLCAVVLLLAARHFIENFLLCTRHLESSLTEMSYPFRQAADG